MWNRDISHIELGKRIRQNDIGFRENLKPRTPANKIGEL